MKYFFASLAPWTIVGSFVLAGNETAGLRAAESETIRAYAERSQRRQAYGVYLKNQKFGWGIDDLKVSQHEGQEAAILTFEMQGRFNAFGEISEFSEQSTTVYSLEGEGRVLWAEEKSIEDGREIVRTITRDGDEMMVTTRSAGGETRHRVPRPKECLAMMRDLEQWLKERPKKGERFESYSTTWEAENIDTKEVYIYRGLKPILWGGVPTDVYLVNVNIEGMLADFEVLADGTPIKGVMGGLFELRAEKESIAKQLDAESVDMLEASSILVKEDLGDPEQVEHLTLKITGPRNMSVPTSHRQKIASRRGRNLTLELSKDYRAKSAVPLTETERAGFLKSTPSIQSDHEDIRNLAKTIIGEAADPVDQARKLQQWVYDNLRQTMASNSTSALDVLKNRAGDCTELTLLFISLARAIGLPAREVGGVMYANEGIPLFGWHAWAEIHDGHQWVSVDPTWNQVYVDATHIKLSEDVNDWSWVNFLGKVKFQVVKFSKAKDAEP